MKSVHLISILATAIVAMSCMSVIMDDVSAEGIDNDQGTVTYYTYTVDFQFRGTDAQSILWEFGFEDDNGNPVTSTEWNPGGIVFPGKGTYTVVQTVSNSVGSYVSQLRICIKGTPEIVFESDGGTPVDMQTVKVGNKVVEPPVPVKEGYVFAGWYTDPSLTDRYDFSEAVAKHMTLHAKWTASVPGDDGGDGEDKDSERTGKGLDIDLVISLGIAVVGSFLSISGLRSGRYGIILLGTILAVIGGASVYACGMGTTLFDMLEGGI